MNRPFFLGLLAFALLLAGCTVALPASLLSALRPPLSPIQVAEAGTVTFRSSGQPVRDLMLSNVESQQLWQQKRSMFPVGGTWETWLSQFTASAEEEPVPERGLVRLVPHQKWVGRLLLSNVWKTPHDIAVIFLLDYKPMRVDVASRLMNAYYVTRIPVGAEDAFEFMFPPLDTGLHHLSILLIGDPHSTSTDIAYRMAQRNSFSEQRFDLWVGIDRLPVDVPIFADQEQATAALGASTPCDLVCSDQPDKLISNLDLRAGTEGNIILRFQKDMPKNQTRPDDFPLPLKLGIFWDDHLQSVADYTLHPPYGESLELSLSLHTPGEPGLHQLQVVAFEVPAYAQFDAEGKWIAYGHAMFAQRVPVTLMR